MKEATRRFIEVWTPIIRAPGMDPVLREQRYKEWIQVLVEMKLMKFEELE